MSSRATFGEFLDAASGQLAAPVGQARPPDGGEDLLYAGQSVRRVIVALAHYVQDIASGFGTWPDPRHEPTPWDQATADAQQELNRAARHLTPAATIRTNPGTRPTAGVASRMDRAAALLGTGRELLDTHFQSGPDGSRGHHSEWAAALASPALRRALLAEVAYLARQTAAHSDRLATQPGWRGAPGPRRALSAATECLRAVNDSVRAAQQHEPVPADQHELLAAIPVSMLPPRRLPGHDDDVAGLRDGVIASAQRIRRAAWHTTARPGSSPAITITSLRQLASASTITSHHCELLLHAAADRAALLFPDAQTTHDMAQAADAAAIARASWLAVARTLDRVTTDGRGKISQASQEAGDLAMWTGRLAYADPEWTLTSGPDQRRPPASLVRAPADIPLIIATVHYTLDTLEAAADAEHDQAQNAAAAGRLLVPTRCLPRAQSTQPFTPAPEARVFDLLAGYRTAGRASARAVTAVARVAESVVAPSRILTIASDVAGVSHDDRRSRAHDYATYSGPDWPGPLEASMYQLGVTSPWLVQRAVALDRASAELIMDAAAEPGTGYDGTPAETLSESASTAAIVSDALASGDARAAALLQSYAQQPEIPDREP